MNENDEDDEMFNNNEEEINEIANNYLIDVIDNSIEKIEKHFIKKRLYELLNNYYYRLYVEPEDISNTLYNVRKCIMLRKNNQKKTKVRRASFKYEKNEVVKFYQAKAEMLMKDVILKAAANVYHESMAYIRIIIKLQSAYRGRISRLLFKIRKMNEDIKKEEKKLFKNKKIYNIVKRMIKIPGKGLEIKGGGLFNLNG